MLHFVSFASSVNVNVNPAMQQSQLLQWNVVFYFWSIFSGCNEIVKSQLSIATLSALLPLSVLTPRCNSLGCFNKIVTSHLLPLCCQHCIGAKSWKSGPNGQRFPVVYIPIVVSCTFSALQSEQGRNTNGKLFLSELVCSNTIVQSGLVSSSSFCKQHNSTIVPAHV